MTMARNVDRRTRTPPRADARRRARTSRRRRVAHGADVHRAEQDPRPRLSARRDHGPADVRRGHLPAADGRAAVARHRPADGRDPGLVHRPRRDAAVDAGRAQHRDDRRAAARVRRRRRARLRPLSRRRHRELHAVPRHRARRSCARAIVATATRPSAIVERLRRRRRDRRRASATGSTRAIRARRGCSRWRSSSRSRASTSR